MIASLGKSLVNKIVDPLGYVCVPKQWMQLYYQHDYGDGGFARYRNVQIEHNKRKIDKVWADSQTLSAVAAYVSAQVPNMVRGICHGTRNGYEQAELSKALSIPVIGTEISDTAQNFPNTVHWDFHEQRDDWVGAFSFGYTNSLDQAFDPKRALRTWIGQLRQDGLFIIEHTMAHSAQGAGEMDPFGAHPMVMPYLLFEWGKGFFELSDIVRLPHRKPNYPDLEIWLFVLRPMPAPGAAR